VHPSYSGGALTATVLLANALGWPYFEQLARQGVLQVPSPAEAVDRIAAGERSAMVYGSEQVAFRQKAAGAPVGIVYPADGTPGVPSATAILRTAPHPNAARLLATWLVGKEAQEIVVASGARSYHPEMREPAGRTTLSAIKVLNPDPILISADADLVKTFYSQLFAK
jgi:iron(III) transport system substrate-binding protein